MPSLRALSKLVIINGVLLSLETDAFCLTSSTPRLVLAPRSFIGCGVQGCLSRRASRRHERLQTARVTTMRDGVFDKEHLVKHLEEDMKGDLAILAHKFGQFIPSLEDIENVHIGSIDGDEMNIEVVYCEAGTETCIAVDVPIRFPHHCDTEEEVEDAIHELEALECDDEEECRAVSDHEEFALENARRNSALNPELVETMRRIEIIMNLDFQSELQGLYRSWGARSTRDVNCEMQDLSPYGFTLVSREGEGPVSVLFSRECRSASDFQQQILKLSLDSFERQQRAEARQEQQA